MPKMLTVALLALALAVPASVALAHAGHAVVEDLRAAMGDTNESYKGHLVCAKCGLKKPDAQECQDVLVVENGGTTTEYYITKNEVAEKAGEACTQKVPATVTGTVAQKDGKTWLTPSKIEKH
jgi:hypothetical protein